MDITLERIIEQCKESGKTQKELTEELCLGQYAFSEWKSGKSKSYTKYIYHIAEFLNVSVDYLLGKTDIKEKAPAKSESSFTEAELTIIEMYRALDDAGKITVGTVLKKEYDRAERAKGLIPSTVAARSVDGSETVHTEYLPDLSKIPADDTDL